MKRLLTALVALVALATLAMGAPNALAATDIPNTDDNVTNVKIGGSDTTYGVLSELGKLYNESDGCALNSVAIKATPPATVPQQNRCQGATTPESAASAAQATVVKTENYDHDLIINYFPQGSNAGRSQLCAQLNVTDPNRLPQLAYVDVARSSSAPNVGFQCTVDNGAPTPATGGVGTQRVLRFIAFARDAITWIGWNGGSGSAVTNLTVAQLQGIYRTCTITNWNQVGGASAPIIAYTAITGSGTRSTWDSFLGGSTDVCIPAAFKDGNTANGERVIREHQAAPVEDAVNDPAAANQGDAIFFMSVGIHNTCTGCAQSSLLRDVNGITPTETTIVNGTFPFGRLMYNVIIQSGPSPVASEATRRFTTMRTPPAPANDNLYGFLCKPLNSHAKPAGPEFASDPGTVTNNTTKSWGKLLDTALRSTGFIPLSNDPNAVRCTFADYIVNQSTQDAL